MSLERGFDTDLFVYTKVGSGSAKWYKVCTVGDMSYTNSRSAIEVRNRSSEKVRVVPGMQTWNISLGEVQKGTDPEDNQDTTGFDFAAALMEMYSSKSPRYFNFGGTLTNGTISGGETELLICTNMSPNAPVDGLYSYAADLAISAIHADSTLTPSNLPSNAQLPSTGDGTTTGGGTTPGGTTTGGDDDTGTDGDVQTADNPTTTNP